MLTEEKLLKSLEPGGGYPQEFVPQTGRGLKTDCLKKDKQERVERVAPWRGGGSWWLRPRVQGVSLFTVCLSGPFKLYSGDKCYQLKPVSYVIHVYFKVGNTHAERDSR